MTAQICVWLMEIFKSVITILAVLREYGLLIQGDFYNISNINTIKRCKVAKVFKQQNDCEHHGRIELDTHADCFVAGRNCQVMHYTERVCDVLPYSDDYEARQRVPIVQAATGHTAADGRRFILIANEALWMPDLEHSLMNPNQVRHYGIKVQDNPFVMDPMILEKDDEDEPFVACFKSEGLDIFIETWTPSDRDLNECKHIVLTSPNEWNPQKVELPGLAQSEVDEIEGYNILELQVERKDNVNVAHEDPCLRPVKIFDIRDFNARIMKSAIVSTKVSGGISSEDDLMPPRTFLSRERHSNTTPEDLSEVWNISLQQAAMTLDATTQRHARSAIMPLSRRYRVDRMFEPMRLRSEIASDTMDPRCDGLHGMRHCFSSKVLSQFNVPNYMAFDLLKTNKIVNVSLINFES